MLGKGRRPGEYRVIMRSRFAPWLAVLTLVAAGTAAAAGYGLTAPKRYRATAELMVAPVSPDDPTFAGIGVLRDTGGRRTAAADVAALLVSPQLAQAVAAQLALGRPLASLQHDVRAHVVDSSDVVAVTARDASANGAAQLANAFANTFVTQRSVAFQAQLGVAIKRDESLMSAIPRARRSSGEGSAIARSLTTLRDLEGQQDPTVRVVSQATPPTSAAWPSVPRLIGIGAAIGAGVGLLVALLLLALRRNRPSPESGLERLVERLEARLAGREAALAARERDLRAAVEELRDAQIDGDLAERERALESRVAAVTAREVELARRAAALALRDRAARHDLPSAPEPSRNGSYNLVTLERLAVEHAAEFPDRVEEWSSYLYFLRDYAAADGSVPARFDGLVAETFAELL